jgi:DNA-binding MarR family transcriptional regulator
MNLDRAVQIIQVSYPQVYLACHTRHQRKRSSEHRLSARDGSILSHLDEHEPIAPARLATHLGIAKSTLSEALKRLIALGYVRRAGERDDTERDRRFTAVTLTRRGAQAIQQTSVLETNRLAEVLATLPDRELQRITAGMTLLARACRHYSERTSRRGQWAAR